MAALGSMAAWCTHRAGLDGASADIHFNYWRVTQKGWFNRARHPSRDFAEVGVWISNPQRIEHIKIFLPFKLSDTELQDCGPHFKQIEIAQGIFNEPLTCHSAGPPGPARLELLREGQPFCRVHLFAVENNRIDQDQLTIVSEADGTLITVTRLAIDEICHQLANNCPAYVRLRAFLPIGDPRPFVDVTSPHDRYIQSGFDEIECVDFRLNEARTLPQRIEFLMRTPQGEHPVPLSQVAFLTAIPVAAELTGTSVSTHKNRVLEREIWDSYIGHELPTGMMVYHWRSEKTPVADFSAFVKLRIRRSSFPLLLTYILVAFFFGVLGNLAASRIDSWISPKGTATVEKGKQK